MVILFNRAIPGDFYVSFLSLWPHGLNAASQTFIILALNMLQCYCIKKERKKKNPTIHFLKFQLKNPLLFRLLSNTQL